MTRSEIVRSEENLDERKGGGQHATPISRRRFLREIFRLSVAIPATLLLLGAAGCAGGEEDEGEEEDD